MRRITTIAAVAATAIIGVSATACAEEPTGGASEKDAVAAVKTDAQNKPAEKSAPKSVEKELREEQLANPEPKLSAAEENAVRAAEMYLDTMAFSKSGLFEQLRYEGYSKRDAEFAVKNVDADWNEQAAKAAQTYLDTMPFSRSSLIEQLEYSGFTTPQATYGVDKAGL